MSQPFSLSRNGVPIRLTDERWQHIIQEHTELTGLRDEVLKTVTDAERVLSGTGGELLAVRMIESGKALVVVYRESGDADGFVITAFLTRRLTSLDRRAQIWPQQT
jgi:hypothetical protein